MTVPKDSVEVKAVDAWDVQILQSLQSSPLSKMSLGWNRSRCVSDDLCWSDNVTVSDENREVTTALDSWTEKDN